MDFIDVNKPIATYTVSKEEVIKLYYITKDGRLFYGINNEKPRHIHLMECQKGRFFKINYRKRYYLQYFTPCEYKE